MKIIKSIRLKKKYTQLLKYYEQDLIHVNTEKLYTDGRTLQYDIVSAKREILQSKFELLAKQYLDDCLDNEVRYNKKLHKSIINWYEKAKYKVDELQGDI